MTSAETNRKDIYAKWAKEYKESIVISKENDYYIGRGDAMPILSDLFGNKLKKIISDDDIALGSPNLNKITSKLEEQYISYIVVNGDVIVRERSFKNNFWNRYKKNEVPVNHTAKTEGNITTSLSLDKKFNNISVGMQLFCKMRGPVIVSKVEE